MSSTVYLGRQPILDRHRRTYGYELLFRNGTENAAFFQDPDDATRCLVERALLEWGIDHVLHGRLGFVNVGSGFLLSGMFQVLPPSHIVLELLEDIVYTEDVIEVVHEAHRAGYRLALDDIIDPSGLAAAVLPVIDILKVDVLATPQAELVHLIAELRRRAPGAQLLAEKVEEVEDFDRCMELGFDLFQGYFFARPEILSRTSRPVDSTAALALLVEVQQPMLDMDTMEELVIGDPTLAFRLLALVNSSVAGLTSRVASVHQAIVLLGIDQVRQLATLLTMAVNSRSNQEIVVLAATRARMAQILSVGTDHASSAFTVGLLSVIDTIFQTPMEILLRELPLEAPVVDALLGRGGPLGKLLDTIMAYEAADLDALQQLRPGQLDDLRLAFGEATAWADDFRRQLVAN